MAVLSRIKLISQERFDLEDFNSLLSALRTDSKFWTKQVMSGENYVIKGFSVSGIGLNTATVEMDNATLIMGANTNDFSWFSAEDSPTDISISDGDLVDGVRNYVELKLGVENNTPIVKSFWDPSANGGLGQEFNQQIDTMVDLKVDVEVSQGGFTGSPDRIPLAIIDTDGAGIIKVILDKRPLFFRLGSNTDPDAEFSWVSQDEPVYNLTLTSVTGTFVAGETITIGGGVTATVVTGGTTSISMRLPSGVNFSSGDAVVGGAANGTLDTVLESFTGADKDVDDFREALSAVMTEIKRIKGTRFWYQTQNNSLEGISQYINSVIVGITGNARYSWSGTEFTITDDNGAPADADVIAKVRLFGRGSDIDLTRQDGSGGSSTIPVSDGEVVFLKIPASGDRAFSGNGVGDTNFQKAALADYDLSDENYWIAYREGANLYVRGYGEMQAGEEAQISDPVTAQILTFIGAVDETDSDPNYTSTNIVTQSGSLVNAISELDNATSGGLTNANQDRTMKLVRGGTWNWTLATNTLSWSADAFLQIAGLAEDVNEISAGNAVLAVDGDVAYVQAKRTAGASTLTVAVGNISSLVLTDNITIIARRVGNDILVGKSFLLKDGEYLELDGFLAELNRQLGQLKLRPHESAADKARVDASDVTLLDGNTLSRVIGDFLLNFSGAVINFTTGAILKEDDSTPLGVNFTPQTIPAGEYFWYGVSLLPGSVGADNRQLAQVQVDLADASDAVLANAPRSIMSGDIKLGNVLVQNNGGSVEINDVMRLGPGSGSGSGGAGADAEAEFKRRLDLSPFNFVSTTVFEIDKDGFVDISSTGGYSPGDRAFLFSAGGQTLVSTQSLDTDYLDDAKRPSWVELLVKWNPLGIDTGATYEVSRNGGNEWQAVTMERVGQTDTYRGIHQFADEGSLQSLFADATTDGDVEFNTTTVQAQHQSFTVVDALDLREVDVDILVTGSPVGNLKAKIVADDTGSPSTDPLDVLSFTNLISIPGISTGVQTIDFGNKVLPAGTYHVVLETDQEYKDGFTTSVDSISLRVNSAGSGAGTYNGTTWTSTNGIKFDIKGIELDLRVRITSSISDALIDSYGIFYDRTPGVTADGELGVDVFEFSGDANRTDFTLVNINNPHPDLLTCYDVFRGQTYVANEGVFRIEGQDIIFDPNFFNDPGETIRLKFVQVVGAAFDTSDANASRISTAEILISQLELNRKNYAQNAEFRFFQRQDPTVLTSVNDSDYGPDRWRILTSGTSAQVARVEDSPIQSPTRYCGQIRQEEATARQMGAVQFLESHRIWELRGKTVTFAVWVRSDSTEISQIKGHIVEWTGASDSITSDIVSSWAATPTLVANASYAGAPEIDEAIDENWKQISITVTVSQTANNLMLFLWTPNTEAQNNDLYITQAQLVSGTAILPWRGISLNYGEDLIDCERFYQIPTFGALFSGAGNNSVPVNFTTNMRAVPIFITSKASGTFSSGTTLYENIRTNGFRLTCAGGSAGALLATGSIPVEAEL